MASPLYAVIQKQLASIGGLKTPKGKIVRLVNVCKLISGMLSEQAQSAHSKPSNGRLLTAVRQLSRELLPQCQSGHERVTRNQDIVETTGDSASATG